MLPFLIKRNFTVYMDKMTNAIQQVPKYDIKGICHFNIIENSQKVLFVLTIR